ncbi:hypothetical protein ABPG74_014113 [Tetrahymena malaccensis]
MDIFDNYEDDEYDRYKVIKPVVQKHKRFFFIQNLQKLADNLQVPDTYLVEYICIKSNCQKEIYQKSNYLIKTSLCQVQVEELINEFTNTYLKCSKCHLLEYQIKVNQSKSLLQSKCASCGQIKSHTLNDEMNQFIFNNPPQMKKKFDIVSGRGFLNDYNQDFDYSDQEEENINYSYEDSDSQSDIQEDEYFEAQNQGNSSSEDISFENEQAQENELKVEQQSSVKENEYDDNQNTNECDSCELSSSNQNFQTIIDRKSYQDDVIRQNRLEDFMQTNQEMNVKNSNRIYQLQIESQVNNLEKVCS